MQNLQENTAAEETPTDFFSLLNIYEKTHFLEHQRTAASETFMQKETELEHQLLDHFFKDENNSREYF